jgi:hypothetical protein
VAKAAWSVVCWLIAFESDAHELLHMPFLQVSRPCSSVLHGLYISTNDDPSASPIRAAACSRDKPQKRCAPCQRDHCRADKAQQILAKSRDKRV